MSQEGRGSQQIRRSAGLDLLCSRMLGREDMETIPFVGEVAGETPAICYDGARGFGRGVPTQNGSSLDVFGLMKPKQNRVFMDSATSHGTLRLSASDAPVAYLPSVEAVKFLSTAQGTRLPPPPTRFFSP